MLHLFLAPSLLCQPAYVPHGHNHVPSMYMQKSAWIALPCLALPAESARPPKKERCAVEQMQEKRTVGGTERGFGQQGLR